MIAVQMEGELTREGFGVVIGVPAEILGTARSGKAMQDAMDALMRELGSMIELWIHEHFRVTQVAKVMDLGKREERQ
ncbi:hypothetical protein RGQ15_22345 [Paracoccus sp. MBLB3053]|uniref:Type II toxin-antitoxin system HicB family antitoxin n=1 Tax=Paracoccus aurantius TaxID=3073814 RepID=A0ABU2HZ21_9RHOB|nr:hypothetical protein [Paracoccus sp. MBLB3053]MDS9470290.1 hypothetical protein [Paracoccus sp. MBLB3053]